jgi:hypothetical protein
MPVCNALIHLGCVLSKEARGVQLKACIMCKGFFALFDLTQRVCSSRLCEGLFQHFLGMLLHTISELSVCYEINLCHLQSLLINAYT